MDDWNKLNETSLPDKKVFYSELCLENILMKTISMLKSIRRI